MILLDVGSTNSRGWLVRDGQIVSSRGTGVGVRDSAREGTTSSVRAAVAGLVRALAPADEEYGVAAAGMITSAQGIAEISHVHAPASAEDLARAAIAVDAPDISPVPIVLVPGVRTVGADPPLHGDVMRGEETLVVGLVEAAVLNAPGLVLNAGSHWKLIAVDGEGRIAWSRTTLGGEIVHALQEATLLSASLPRGPLPAVLPGWLDAGADAAASEGLLRAFFEVRLLDQRGDTTAEQRFAWLVGACISDDVRAWTRRGLLPPGSSVAITGPGAVPAAWAHLLRREGHEPVVLPADVVERAFVSGLGRIVALRAVLNVGFRDGPN